MFAYLFVNINQQVSNAVLLCEKAFCMQFAAITIVTNIPDRKEF